MAGGTAALSPLVPWWLTAGAAGLLATAVWRPEWALFALLAAAPWGARLADVPVRATEYLCVAFLAGRLLRLDKPLGLSSRGARAAAWPAFAYGLLAVVSWVRLVLAATHSRGWTAVVDAARLLPADYLVTAGRDPHTAAALQILLGIAMCFSAFTLVANDTRMWRGAVAVIALTGVVAAAVTVIAVPVRYWLSGDANELIRYFVITRSRYSFHVPDVNAAGSHFILGALLAMGALGLERRRRVGQALILVITFAALWISGSRAAMGTGVLLAAFWLHGWRLVRAGWRWPSMSTRTVGGAAAATLVALVMLPTVVGSASAMSGSASRSMSVREEFLVTSARMLATAPVLGVGVGTYYQRSGEFMPPGIRALYGRENAHDYFMQTAAELGGLGLVAFAWWLGAALAPLWRRLGEGGRPTVALALLLGCVGFLLTCVTGHPLLVVEVSVPFWAALGVAMSADATATFS
jgi:O-antigen ligase